jgi:PleD family two-component response regulator
MGEGLRALTAGIRLTSQQPGETQPENVRISAKIGVASTENSGRSINPLLNEADYALYQNRNEGRDRTDLPRNNI